MKTDAWKAKTPRGVSWTYVPRDNGTVGAKWWNPDKQPRAGYQWITTFESQGAAEMAEHDWNDGVGKRHWTVAEWADFWLEHFKRPSPGTNLNYKYAVAAIVAAFGPRSMDAIDRPEGRAMALTWRRDAQKAARAMWNDALDYGAATGTNPFARLGVKQSPGRRDIDALTEDECAALARIAEETLGDFGFEFGTMLTTIGFVAMRPGEVFALGHDDLRLDDLETHVRYAVDATRRVAPTKNKEERTVTVPPPAAARLARMPRRLIEEDGKLAPDPLVFRTPRGKRFNKSSFYYYWREVHAIWRANGGRELDPYELRHAGATHFIERGASSADVALQLGHKDGGRLVEALYGHPSHGPARDRLKLAYAQRSQAERQKRGYAG